MSLTKFNLVKARFNKGQQISFFLLGTLILLTIVILTTIYINKNLSLQINTSGMAALIFFLFEYVIAAIVFISKAKGSIDFDDEVVKIILSKDNDKLIGYWELEKIELHKGKKVYFLASDRTPKIYTVIFHFKQGYPIKLKIEDIIWNRQSLLPARIHEVSEKYRIPLIR